MSISIIEHVCVHRKLILNLNIHGIVVWFKVYDVIYVNGTLVASITN